MEEGNDSPAVGRAQRRAHRADSGALAIGSLGAASIGTYWRTLRHLKLRQLTGRVVFRLKRPKPDLAAPPPRRSMVGAWKQPAAREPSLLSPLRFKLLSVEGDLLTTGWNGPGPDRLWRYNQHYFDDLNARGAANRAGWHADLVAHWLAANAPGTGTGWEPYPTSLRIVNWVKWWLAGHAASPAALHSLAVQARWLRQKLEWHLLGNHLFANAKALVFAGLFFEGDEASQWLACGLGILQAELPEQVLADGGHFERSPMYHALALEDVLDLLNLLRASGRGGGRATSLHTSLEQRAPLMLHWLRCMSHPDGGLAFFNDATSGIAPDTPELERYAGDLGVVAGQPGRDHMLHLSASGYVRVTQGPLLALIDTAPVGPDYLPGHANADTLSFELSFAGRRVVTNGGTSCYGVSAERLRQRGTAAHSTVQVAGKDSSEVWSGFRVGRRAWPFDVRVSPGCVQASHDGYRWLAGKPVHQRKWTFESNGVVVEDQIVGGAHQAVARFHLAPGMTLESAGAGRWRLMCEARQLGELVALVGEAAVHESMYAPSFGVLVGRQVLTVQLAEGRAKVRISLNPGDAHTVSK